MYFRTKEIAWLVVAVMSSTLLGQTALTIKLKPEYKTWLDEDVRWIVTQKEKREFLSLSDDGQRDRFIVDFWKRRNPTPLPSGESNPFKREHYRRLAYSNEHFAEQAAGAKTDRGRIYIVYGPPDTIVRHPSTETSPASEQWRYRRLPGGGEDIVLRFVDQCACGIYSLESDPPNKEWQN